MFISDPADHANHEGAECIDREYASDLDAILFMQPAGTDYDDPAPVWVLDINWSAVAFGALLIAWNSDGTVRSVFQFVCELSNGEPGVYDAHEGVVNAPTAEYTVYPPHPCVPLPRVTGWQVNRTERAIEFDRTAHGDFPLSWK